ncbi:MAG: hypothetical protein IJK28_13170 [Clostridia bacterium]|nr:hypothetical protein [Clostridia bacterium]MBQ6177794.1 hypothetical protein [Bacteroidales bacterium]
MTHAIRRLVLWALALALGCAAGAAAAEITIGGTAVFGAYEQDGVTENGPEAIEWLILDVRDGSALLISRYALDVQPFHTRINEVTWEKCAIRAWLNGEFLSAAFDEAQQALIRVTEIDNGIAQSDAWCANGGPATQDRVFLLSFAESTRYFGDDRARMCVPTAYALAQGARINEADVTEEGAACWWWLRSPGFYRYYAASVLASGARTNLGGVDSTTGAVRPVIWVEAGALGEE